MWQIYARLDDGKETWLEQTGIFFEDEEEAWEYSGSLDSSRFENVLYHLPIKVVSLEINSNRTF